MFLTMGVSGGGVYFFFATMMILSLFFVWLTVPETKGVPLEAVDRLFQVKPVRRAHAVVLVQVRAEFEAVRSAKIGNEESGTGQEKQEVVHLGQSS